MLTKVLLLKLMFLRNPDDDKEKGSPGDPEKKEKESGKSEIDLLKEIEALKAKSVSLEKYEKLKKEKNQIIKEVLNGEKSSIDAEKAAKKTLKDYVKDLQNDELTNLDYIDTALKARQACIDERGFDPFAGRKGSTEDAEKAANVAETLQKCVDEAEGSPLKFQALLQENMVDPNALTQYLAKRKRLTK